MGNGEWVMGNGESGIGNRESGMGNREMGNGKWESIALLPPPLKKGDRGGFAFDSSQIKSKGPIAPF